MRCIRLRKRASVCQSVTEGKQLETVAPGYAEGGCWNKSLGSGQYARGTIEDFPISDDTLPHLTLSVIE